MVRHLDPKAAVAEIWIDGYKRGRLAYSQEISIPIKAGSHSIKATRPLHDGNGWGDDGQPWVLIVEEDVTLTLLPSGKAVNERRPQKRGPK